MKKQMVIKTGSLEEMYAKFYELRKQGYKVVVNRYTFELIIQPKRGN